MQTDALKAQAAFRAADHIHSGMCVGLGTGSTSRYFVLELARRVQMGLLRDLVCVPTSQSTEILAVSQGLAVERFQNQSIDIAVDGADEVDPQWNLIKGLGAALLCEKLVESNAKRLIIIADHSKCVDHLGQRSPVPIELVPFGVQSTLVRLGRFGKPRLRCDALGQPHLTDGGNLICDLNFAGSPSIDIATLAAELKLQVGVIETGFFVSMATGLIVASPEGLTERFK
ncbi:MAG: ribose 5-phosphate isomerase A [Deinococcaceae bacterium]